MYPFRNDEVAPVGAVTECRADKVEGVKTKQR